MMPFIKQRIGLLMSQSAGPGSTLAVYWNLYSGTITDDVTGAQDGGTTTLLSGTMRCFDVEEGVRSVVRKFQEIQVGDLIVDVMAPATVTLPDGSQLALEGLDGVRFERPPGSGKFYRQGTVGEELADAWCTRAGDMDLLQTLLLRKAT